MLTDPERAVLIEKLRRLPGQIEFLAAALSPAELAGHFLAGEWSAAQNIHHLADSHMNSYVRCRLMLTEEEPPLKPYDQELWAALPDAEAADVTPSLLLLRGLHGRWVPFFTALPAYAWQRTGLHPERGLVTLEDQLVLYAGHGEAHIEQMRRTVAAQYSALPASTEELLARIDREWDRLDALLARYTPEQWETPVEGGWTPKVHLAHVMAWERYLLGSVFGDQPLSEAIGLSEPALAGALATGMSQVDAENALLAAQAQNKPLAQVQAEAQAVHAQVRATAAGLDLAAWLASRSEWEGEPRSGLDIIAGNTYDHYLEHWQWLPIV